MTAKDLRSLRLWHGLTQRALADLLGYTPNYIARLERGEEPMTPRFAKLATLLLDTKKIHGTHKKVQKISTAP